jgi:hypothetical protein
MKRLTYAFVVFLLAAASPSFQSGTADRHWLIATASAAPKATSKACAFPTHMASTPEETAWQLFVAATCGSNNNQVAWENWIEQLDLYPAGGQAGAKRSAKHKRLHGSPLTHVLAVKLDEARGARLPELAPSSECNIMHGPPPNVVKGATICEEAHLNPEAQRFVSENGFEIRPGQTKAAQQGTNVQFPSPAVEVKADWIPASDFTPPLSCSTPLPGVHVEIIDGACYALAGLHISSKLLPNWLWATFEPQNLTTNLNRCKVLGCNDPWGSSPATSSGDFTQQTPALKAMMTEANLAPEWFN